MFTASPAPTPAYPPKRTHQVHLLPASNPAGPSGLRCVQPQQAGLEYFVEHHRGSLVMLTNHQQPTTNRQRGPSQQEVLHEHAPRGGRGDGSGGGSGYRLISGSGGGSDDGSSGASGYGSGGGDGGGRSGGSGSGHGTGGGSGYRLLTVPVSAADWGKEAWRVLLDPPGMAATMWAHPDTASDLLDPLRKADLHMSTGFEIVDMDMFDGWYVWAALVGGCVGSVCGGLPSWRASIHGLCPT